MMRKETRKTNHEPALGAALDWLPETIKAARGKGANGAEIRLLQAAELNECHALIDNACVFAAILRRHAPPVLAAGASDVGLAQDIEPPAKPKGITCSYHHVIAGIFPSTGSAQVFIPSWR